jgi:mRNA interferase RelE/StbE
MKVEIRYTKRSVKFLKKNGYLLKEDQVVRYTLKACRNILLGEKNNIDLKALKGDFKGFYRIRRGDIRIIFSLNKKPEITIVRIENIGFRGKVYK